MLKQNMTKGYLKTSQIDEGFVSLFNKPGPYYSSYPVLGEWKNIQNNNNYIKSLKLFFKNNPNKALHLYLHIPYCAKLCYYCSCRIHISNKRETINSFVMSLVAEINMLNEFFNNNNIKPNFKEIHLGGGTPSHLTTDEIQLIIDGLNQFVDIKSLKEFSMEIDPRTVNFDDFDYYASFGVDRISFGVQDFDSNVQEKINRIQPFKLIESLIKQEIQKKFKGVNFDLLYGLPGQTIDTFRETIRLTKLLAPERITLIKYAHIPNIRKHMKMIKETDLPDEKDLPIMFLESTEALVEAGYEWVGIDHFAKKDDQLAIAKKNRTVYRNFGGETPGFTKDIISLGPTSTSSFGNNYFQATYNLPEYKDNIEKNIFPIAKHYELSKDDLIRRECNFSLQCNQILDINFINKKYNINFEDYFETEISRLLILKKKEFLTFSDNLILVTTLGRYFIRHICQVFDTFLEDGSEYKIHGN
jgi:oxygen-independent coproporphyrinogen-3 oxidase